MRIILPIEFCPKGGVERVAISLALHLAKYAEKVVILVYASQLEYFQSILPASAVITYETFALDAPSLAAVKLALLRRSAADLGKLQLTEIKRQVNTRISLISVQYRLEQLIKKYSLDYCLYPLINKITPPQISIPLAGISHDLFWQFSPLTYSETYREKYNKYLKMWLDEADLIFTVSEKTRSDILKIFPQQTYERKVKTILSAGSSIALKNTNKDSSSQGVILFYFPSSFSIYKDHLTLFRAIVNLAQKNYNFQVILTGKDTDKLVQGMLDVKQQSLTQEYETYLKNCQEFLLEHRDVIQKYVQGWGYTDYEKVEYYYQTCDCVVMPSQYEGFGLAIAESLLLGIPVVAAELDVYKEQVELYQSPERVDFFPPGDGEALAQALEKFILNPKPRLSAQEIAANVRPWTWDDVAQEYIKTLKTLG